jgi:Flp pilus assembly pilin Flp
MGAAMNRTVELAVERMWTAVERLSRTDDGQDLLEYALVVALIAVASVIAVGSLGTTVTNTLWRAIDLNF